jgi:death-on-curing protein
MSFEEKELYPTLWDKAGALMESLVRNHPFVDGNKRVGLVAAGLFLERNEYALAATNDAAYEFTMSMARGELNHEAAAEWFREHSEPIEDRTW